MKSSSHGLQVRALHLEMKITYHGTEPTFCLVVHVCEVRRKGLLQQTIEDYDTCVL
jgi:hypothetical protein